MRYGNDVISGITRSTGPRDSSSVDFSTIQFREHEAFAGLKVFTCERLNAVLTADSCAANYTRANQPASCKGCSIGLKHSGGSPMKETQHEVPANQQSLSCIRCERTEATATKYIGRFRIIKRQHCINCFNREREVIKGANGKGAKPVKHAGLRQATITIRLDGKIQEHDIGLRWSRQECERYVKRIIPGAELLKVEIDGELILPDAPVPAVKALGSKPVQPAKPKANKPLRVASEREAVSNDDGDLVDQEYNAGWFNASKPKRALPTASDKLAAHWENDRSIVWNKRPLESDEDELILDAWPTLAADTLPQFVTWLASDWPTLASEARATPSEVRAPVADSEAAVSRAWREVFGDLSEQPIKRACKSTWDLEPDLSPEEDAAYRASFDSEAVAPLEPVADTSAQPEPVVTPENASQGRGVRADLAGKRFGRLTAVARNGSDAHNNAVWLFRCDCSIEKSIRAIDVKSGDTKSCGCLHRERVTLDNPRAIAARKAAKPSEPITDAAALRKSEQPVVVDSGKRMSPKLAAKQQARAEREQRKTAAEEERLKLPRPTAGAVAARGAVLVAQFLYHKHTLTKPDNATQS
jgi:hypothetical protein